MDQADPKGEPRPPAGWPPSLIVVDARGLDCPRPVLLARRALARCAPDGSIAVCATDPHAELDFEAFCARTGHRLAATQPAGEVTWYRIVKA